MSNINNFVISGTLTSNPELTANAADSGKTYVTFTIVHNKRVRKEDGSYEEIPAFMNFLRIFGKQAEYFASHAVKGTQVILSGEIDTYLSKQPDGKEYHTLCLRIRDFELGHNRVSAQQQSQSQAQPQAVPQQQPYGYQAAPQQQANPFMQAQPQQQPYGYQQLYQAAPQQQANPFMQAQPQTAPQEQANPFAFDPNAFDPGTLPFN